MSNQEPLIKIIKTDMFPIDKLSTGKHQVRTRNVDQNLEPLMNSLKKFGQLSPITIYEENGKYEVLTGQRRLNAASKLGWKVIRADLIAKPRDDLISKAISFIENEIREKMSNNDVIKACNEFYYKYGSIKAVSEELALPYEMVSNAVKLPRCPQEVKDAVENGEITLKTAIRSADALKWDSTKSNTNDGQKVLDLAKLMQNNMPRDLQKAIIEVGKSDPSKPLSDIIKEAEDVKLTPIRLLLGREHKSKLEKYAADEEVDEDEAAASLVIDGLEQHGY